MKNGPCTRSTCEAVDAVVRSPAIRSGPVAVLFEDRLVTARDGEVTNRFEPYAVHVYEVGQHVP